MSGLSSPIRLIVGLGNPGDQYVHTRHNAGAWFLEKVVHYYHLQIRHENKFQGLYGNFSDNNEKIHLLIPSTYMNHSGQSVRAVADFFNLQPEEILIAHDELDIGVGDIRLKFAGGHGGHNGLRNIINHIHTPNFYRLRVGINHPGERDAVTHYVLSTPSYEDKKNINQALDKALDVLPYLYKGENEKAMQLLHTKV
jgi:PTH1 family peptidyl-tRNA hydrolase